jgi:hypothetical protein
MGHIICSVKTGPNQSIVKLNLFNYFEKKSKAVLNKYEKAIERNNEIILHFATHPRSSSLFSKSESESSTKLTIIGDMSWMLKFPISLVLVLHFKMCTSSGTEACTALRDSFILD